MKTITKTRSKMTGKVIMITLAVLVTLSMMPFYNTAHAAVAKPGKVSVKTSSTISTVKLKWSKKKYATVYQIRYRKGSGSWKYVTKGSSSRSYTIKGCSPETKYYVNIRAKRKYRGKYYSGPWRWRNGKAVKTKAVTRPGTVNVNVTSTDSSITLKWSGVKYASVYQIRYRRIGDDGWEYVTKGSDSRSFTISGIPKTSAGIRYYVNIRARRNYKGKYYSGPWRWEYGEVFRAKSSSSDGTGSGDSGSESSTTTVTLKSVIAKCDVDYELAPGSDKYPVNVFTVYYKEKDESDFTSEEAAALKKIKWTTEDVTPDYVENFFHGELANYKGPANNPDVKTYEVHGFLFDINFSMKYGVSDLHIVGKDPSGNTVYDKMIGYYTSDKYSGYQDYLMEFDQTIWEPLYEEAKEELKGKIWTSGMTDSEKAHAVVKWISNDLYNGGYHEYAFPDVLNNSLTNGGYNYAYLVLNHLVGTDCINGGRVGCEMLKEEGVITKYKIVAPSAGQSASHRNYNIWCADGTKDQLSFGGLYAGSVRDHEDAYWADQSNFLDCFNYDDWMNEYFIDDWKEQIKANVD